MLRLLDGADVLVAHFRHGVMASFGPAPTMLRERFPRLVIGSISSQGETGPDRDMVSFGSTLEATAGLAALTGAGEAPAITGRDVNYPDQVVCLQGYIIALPGVLTHVRSGAIRTIALASDRRSQVMPELVTTVEQGFPRIIGASWFGPATRVGTPPGRLARLIEAFQATMTDPAAAGGRRARHPRRHRRRLLPPPDPRGFRAPGPRGAPRRPAPAIGFGAAAPAHPRHPSAARQDSSVRPMANSSLPSRKHPCRHRPRRNVLGGRVKVPKPSGSPSRQPPS